MTATFSTHYVNMDDPVESWHTTRSERMASTTFAEAELRSLRDLKDLKYWMTTDTIFTQWHWKNRFRWVKVLRYSYQASINCSVVRIMMIDQVIFKATFSMFLHIGNVACVLGIVSDKDSLEEVYKMLFVGIVFHLCSTTRRSAFIVFFCCFGSVFYRDSGWHQ